eukprot:jgi/Chrpa1/17222/Chrysochromulina_OHIO_Genome00019308-RA
MLCTVVAVPALTSHGNSTGWVWRLANESGGLLSYMPHNGHADQMRQLALARAVAATLHRSLIVPPLLAHFDAQFNTHVSALGQLKLHRPLMSSVLNFTRLSFESEGSSARHVFDSKTLPRPEQLPSCTGLNVNVSEPQPLPLQCVHWVEPPKPPHAVYVADALREWSRLGHVPWIHIRSMLWVHSVRLKERTANPLPKWEEQLETTPCHIEYHPKLLAMARALLAPALPEDSHTHLAAHVRSLEEARQKAERPSHWTKRLVDFVTRAQADLASELSARSGARSGAGAPLPPTILYIAADNSEVAGRAAKLLEPLNTTVVSRLNLKLNTALSTAFHWRHARFGLPNKDDSIASLLVDLAACLSAAKFSASPTSGLSVHIGAMRKCQRTGACTPHYCTRYANTGCGGRFAPPLLRLAGSEALRGRQRVVESRSAGSDFCQRLWQHDISTYL